MPHRVYHIDTRTESNMRRLPLRVSALLTALVFAAGGCGGELAAPPRVRAGPVLSADELGQMRLALIFAQEHSSLTLKGPEANRVTAAFAALAQRVSHNDVGGVEREISLAQSAIRTYQRVAAGEVAGNPELEALTLTLDQVAVLASGFQSFEEHQP
jgi:hypothetical protein